MPWLLDFIDTLIKELSEDLKAEVVSEDDDTDKLSVYYETLAWSQHQPVGKESGQTSYIERFNFNLRQRCAQLVRKTLSFSKKLANHVGMIKYFICDYNLMRRALHV